MPGTFSSHSLTNSDVNRFSRQLVLQGFGPLAQERLRDCAVLIVGAGGLGCPAAIYLAAAGVGTLGIIDNDVVSISNLHRQILHDETGVGTNKAQSIKESISKLNSAVNVVTYDTLLTASNAYEIFNGYQIVVDCSDNVATRYLINDTCVLTGKPLVSGSALGWEGQLTVYNNGPKCPCYRCIFPVPPNPETVTNCSEGGVLGPIVGIIGSLQALEVIRIAVRGESTFAGYLWLFDGIDGRTKTICLREKMPSCAVCGANPTITELQDYVKFCGSGPSDKCSAIRVLADDERITVQEYHTVRENEKSTLSGASGDDESASQSRPLLIDTRPAIEFEICHLPEAKNIPLDELRKKDITTILRSITDNMNKLPSTAYVVCHRGNDSQLAVKLLRDKATASNYAIQFRDLIGGLEKWATDVDSNFPTY